MTHERTLIDARDVARMDPEPAYDLTQVEFTSHRLTPEQIGRLRLRISPFSRLFMFLGGRGLFWSLTYRGEPIGDGRSRTHAGAVRAMDRLTQKTINRQRHKAHALASLQSCAHCGEGVTTFCRSKADDCPSGLPPMPRRTSESTTRAAPCSPSSSPPCPPHPAAGIL